MDRNEERYRNDGNERSSRDRNNGGSKSRSRTPLSYSKRLPRTPSRSRSRSKSPERRSNVRRSPSRSRSRSLDNRRRNSPPPSYGRKPYGQPDAPPPSRCLGVFGMSLYTDEKALAGIFGEYGTIENIQVIYDKQTGRSRGFGFVYFDRLEDAIVAKDRALGQEIDGQKVRVDFSLTKRPRSPTPGMYRGRSSAPRGGDYGGRRRRSRSRSYSPRRSNYY